MSYQLKGHISCLIREIKGDTNKGTDESNPLFKWLVNGKPRPMMC